LPSGVRWVDLFCGEADAHQGVGGDGRCGSGEQAPEGVGAMACKASTWALAKSPRHW